MARGKQPLSPISSGIYYGGRIVHTYDYMQTVLATHVGEKRHAQVCHRLCLFFPPGFPSSLRCSTHAGHNQYMWVSDRRTHTHTHQTLGVVSITLFCKSYGGQSETFLWRGSVVQEQTGAIRFTGVLPRELFLHTGSVLHPPGLHVYIEEDQEKFSMGGLSGRRRLLACLLACSFYLQSTGLLQPSPRRAEDCHCHSQTGNISLACPFEPYLPLRVLHKYGLRLLLRRRG